MNWIDVNDSLPEGDGENGIRVLVKEILSKPRMYGDIGLGVFYKGKFHADFKKGYIQNVSHWMYLPKTPVQ